jgi:hypothetical protein
MHHTKSGYSLTEIAEHWRASWCGGVSEFDLAPCFRRLAEEVSTDDPTLGLPNRPKRGLRVNQPPPGDIGANHGTTRRLGYRGAYVIGSWILACSFTTSCPAQKEITSYSIPANSLCSCFPAFSSRSSSPSPALITLASP